MTAQQPQTVLPEQLHSAQTFWHKFVKVSRVGVVLIVIVLALMAIFLL